MFIDVKEEKRLNLSIIRAKKRERSTRSQINVFKKFEKLYKAYFSSRLSEYDMIVDNNDFNDNLSSWSITIIAREISRK